MVGGEQLGLTSETTEVVISSLPVFMIFMFSGYALLNSIKAVFLLPLGFFGLGLGFAILVGDMHAAGNLIPEMLIDGISLAQLQGYIIVFPTLFGSVLAMIFYKTSQ